MPAAPLAQACAWSYIGTMLRLLAALTLNVALGILSRLHPVGWSWYGKSLGDALYAVAAYLGLAVLFFRWASSTVALLALGWCLSVELFKLTNIPARHADLGIVRWMLGTTFAWHHLACFVVGVVGIAVIDVVLMRPGKRGRGDPEATAVTQHEAHEPTATGAATIDVEPRQDVTWSS